MASWSPSSVLPFVFSLQNSSIYHKQLFNTSTILLLFCSLIPSYIVYLASVSWKSNIDQSSFFFLYLFLILYFSSNIQRAGKSKYRLVLACHVPIQKQFGALWTASNDRPSHSLVGQSQNVADCSSVTATFSGNNTLSGASILQANHGRGWGQRVKRLEGLYFSSLCAGIDRIKYSCWPRPYRLEPSQSVPCPRNKVHFFPFCGEGVTLPS